MHTDIVPQAAAAVLLAALAAPSATAAVFHRDQLAVPASAKVTVSRESYPGLNNPNPNGGYYKCANVVLAKDGSLVACWQYSDDHASLATWIMVARSRDGGHTWGEHRAISHSNVWEHGWVWAVPQMSVLRDGRIIVVVDRGQRRPGQHWPMLAEWQKPDRGMQNWAFWSSDHGATWTAGEKIDDVGGQPGYVRELSDGTLAYTRTSSARTTRLVNPPAPWNDVYYRNEIVFSDDQGRSWSRSAWLADSPFHGDCEVGLAELAPGKLIAATRIGLGNGRFGHPSRLLFSDDNGLTWSRARTAPFYGQRIHINKLRSGRLLATFRNVWGSFGTRALVFDPTENLGFQPQSFILEEERCTLMDETLTVRTEEGKRGAVEFSLYPAQDHVSRVEIEATLRIEAAQRHAAAISAGVWLRFLPDRVCLADRPEAGFPIDARQWHTYRIVRADGFVTVWVDGVEKLREPVGDLWVRQVRFGNRASSPAGGAYSENAGVTHWRSLSAKVRNADDSSIDWNWTPRLGYPDQFRRDRIVVLDTAHPADCGYSMWTQLPDGRLVILDYTSAPSLEPFSHAGGTPPIIRAYLVAEQDLVR